MVITKCQQITAYFAGKNNKAMFQHRLVRDLAWVIASPPLISGNYNDTHWWQHKDCLEEYRSLLPHLKALDKDPTPLIKHLTSLKSQRLGLRFEALVAYWLAHSPNFNLLAHSIQLIDKGHTYGELDFIIEDKHRSTIIHLEVAVKFYLGSPPCNNPYRWFGTNIQDQLGKKTDYLKTVQTQLTDRFPQLTQQTGFNIEEKQCLLKGRLFYPRNLQTPPVGINSNHLRGSWTQSEHWQDTQHSLYPLDKKMWLAELTHHDIEAHKKLHHFENMETARCYAILEKNSEGQYHEVHRTFYLPEGFSFPEAPN